MEDFENIAPTAQGENKSHLNVNASSIGVILLC